MKHIQKTSKIVEQLLQDHPETRNSDDFLYLKVCEKINVISLALPFHEVLLCRKKYKLPPFESVRRTRQKLQKKYPELAGNRKVEEERAENEKIVKSYVKEVKAE